MGMLGPLKQPLLMIATLAALLGASPERAKACSCLPPTVESSYNNQSDVITASILLELNAAGSRWYFATVTRTFKGCLQPAAWVVLTTPLSSAACGTRLSTGRDYLINGSDAGTAFGIRRLTIGLCDYNVQVSALTAHDREFLEGRSVCCGDACTCADGTRPVQCFVDPCQVAEACSEGKCVANYCGGCNAEFYDENGYAVCQDTNECVDLTGADFGPCDAVLGYGVIGGQCQTISGCDDLGHALFSSLDECAAKCGPSCACKPSGCSGQICAAEPVTTTCEWRPEYACYQDATITTCECMEEGCGWAQTPALEACLASADPNL